MDFSNLGDTINETYKDDLFLEGFDPRHQVEKDSPLFLMRSQIVRRAFAKLCRSISGRVGSDLENDFHDSRAELLRCTFSKIFETPNGKTKT